QTISRHSYEELRIDRLDINPSKENAIPEEKNDRIPHTTNLKNRSISCKDDDKNIGIRYNNQVNSEPKTLQPTVLPKDQVPEPLTSLDSDDEQSTGGPSVNLDNFISSAERAYRFL
ncbi:unnamed protein product, partial [Owenia fusiformis]